MEAPEEKIEVEYYLDFYIAADVEPDIEQLKAFVRSLDEQNPWNAGTNTDGEKLPSIADITYEPCSPGRAARLLIGVGQVRVHSLSIKPGNWLMTSWDDVWKYNDYVNEHCDHARYNDQLPDQVVEVKHGIYFHSVS